jgi:hypothetical protein
VGCASGRFRPGMGMRIRTRQLGRTARMAVLPLPAAGCPVLAGRVAGCGVAAGLRNDGVNGGVPYRLLPFCVYVLRCACCECFSLGQPCTAADSGVQDVTATATIRLFRRGPRWRDHCCLVTSPGYPFVFAVRRQCNAERSLLIVRAAGPCGLRAPADGWPRRRDWAVPAQPDQIARSLPIPSAPRGGARVRSQEVAGRGSEEARASAGSFSGIRHAWTERAWAVGGARDGLPAGAAAAGGR